MHKKTQIPNLSATSHLSIVDGCTYICLSSLQVHAISAVQVAWGSITFQFELPFVLLLIMLEKCCCLCLPVSSMPTIYSYSGFEDGLVGSRSHRLVPKMSCGSESTALYQRSAILLHELPGLFSRSSAVEILPNPQAPTSC